MNEIDLTRGAAAPSGAQAPATQVAPVQQAAVAAPAQEPAAAAVPGKEAQPADIGKRPGEPTAAEVLDWTKDDRIEKMWHNDPNGLYKSYRELEKVHGPLKQQFESLQQEHGTVKAILDELKIENPAAIRDIAQQLEMYNGAFGYWLEPERFAKHGVAIKTFFEELRRKENQDRFPGWTDEQIREHQKIVSKAEDMQRKLSETESKQRDAENLKTYDTNMDSITSYAKKVGFDISPEIVAKFTDHLIAEKVPLRSMFGEFVRVFGDQLEKAHADKVRADVLKERDKSAKETVTMTTGRKPLSVMAGDKPRSLLSSDA